MGFALTALKRDHGLVDNEDSHWFLTDAGRAHLNLDAPDEDDDDFLGPPSGVEGRVILRQHRLRERDHGLVAKKKTQARSENGVLRCEVCDLDPVARYGDIGDAIIECHHLLPLSLGDVRETRMEDLALVCRNWPRRDPRRGE